MGSTQGSQPADSQKSANSQKSAKVRQLIYKMKEKNEKFSRIIQNSRSVDKIIIFIGETGSAKSTLINYLAGKELFYRKITHKSKNDDESKEEEKGSSKGFDGICKKKIFADDPIPGIRIGNNRSSETKIPASWCSEDEIAYWDCPGFGDTEKSSQDIINSFYINQLLTNSKEAGVVLAIKGDTILSDERNNRLSSVVNGIAKLGLIHSLQSVSLVVTI